ncbi:hypothetical protein BJ875DRAFT_204335 [Amylocarpus encephaloides]|uniref:Uncharacterized protein n=1 Tax=Amylocarpus encephaloides TaxID=45428 RepID=A0A9P8C7H6_9HELO|nr:hypothetical protein BJ875DRAFT_204335 [Amylocarpus encephaloides]
MAAKSSESSDVEFHESPGAKPSPLRIVKHSTTISCGSTPREVINGRCRPSGSSDQSQGSPPMGSDSPLTVRKKRRGRGSLFDKAFDLSIEGGSSISSDIISNEQEDPNMTPKARVPIPRTAGVGQFLKSELQYPAHSATTSGRFSVRSTPETCYSDFCIAVQPFTPVKASSTYPNNPERQLSKSKSFFLKAIGGRGTPQKTRLRRPSEPIPVTNKDTLVRRFSRSKSRLSDKFVPPPSTISPGYEVDGKFVEPENLSIDDVPVGLRAYSSDEAPSSSYGSNTRPLLSSSIKLVLAPRIVVTPQSEIVDSLSCGFWIAIEISGTLRPAEGFHKGNQSDTRHTSNSSDVYCSERYGYLHRMRVDLLPAPTCYITELIGDLHDTQPIRAGQTRLILAKVSLGRATSSSGSQGSSNEKLIADLETHLGDSEHHYLSISLSYKHSGFANDDYGKQTVDGSSLSTTHLITDVRAAVKRCDTRSAWSPRASRTLDVPSHLMSIVRNRLSAAKADEVIARLLDDRLSSPFAPGPISAQGSGEETVKPYDHPPSRTNTVVYAPRHHLEDSSSRLSRSQSVQNVAHPFTRLPSYTQVRTSPEEMDPARKIWSDLRKNSRSRDSGEFWGNFDAEGFYRMEEEIMATRNSSSSATSSNLDESLSDGSSSQPYRRSDIVDQDRNMILEVALKNKRSIGVESLRSMAPSFTKSVLKSKTGIAGGLGLGVGRSWGWGQSWW